MKGIQLGLRKILGRGDARLGIDTGNVRLYNYTFLRAIPEFKVLSDNSTSDENTLTKSAPRNQNEDNSWD